MIKSILLFALLVPVFAAAQKVEQSKVYCSVRSFIGIEIRNNPEFKALGCDDLRTTFEEAFDKVQRISPVDLSQTFLVIYNHELLKGSRYSWVTSTITMDVKDLAQIDKQIPVFYHEIGHKIYFEAMARIVPEISDRKAALDKYAKDLRSCISSGSFSRCPPSNASGEILVVNNSFSPDFDKYLYINNPYNELFADVVAVLAAEDQNAMAKVMEECTMSDNACEYRAFSKNTIDKFAGENTHSRFSPLRRDLWEGWVVPRLGDQPQLLTDLANILALESYSNWEADYALIEGMSALKELKRLRILLDLKVTESPSLRYGI